MTFHRRCAPASRMTMGKALIAAREHFGPDASVSYHVPENGPIVCTVSHGDTNFTGDSWEAALRQARKDSHEVQHQN